MPPTITELKWSFLTGVVNEIRSPNQFLKRLLFSNHQTLPTEDIELSVLTGGRETAPFVRKNGEGIMVGGHGETFHTVTAPNIRIKRPFTPSNLLYNRRPGSAIFVNGGGGVSQSAAIQQHITRDLQRLADYVTNAEEWLCAQTLTGLVEYAVADQEVFTITFPKPSTHTITLLSARAWDNADATLPRPLQDIHAIKELMADEGLQPDIALCGQNAAYAILELAESGNLPAFKRDSGVSAGTITFVQQFNADGAIFLGEMAGVQFWQYSRTVTHNGVQTPMIRTDYVEFIHRGAAAERVLYYGAIPDMRAIAGGRLGQMERFSKSWEEEDPSAMMALLASRPLPVQRRMGASVSLKVTNI